MLLLLLPLTGMTRPDRNIDGHEIFSAAGWSTNLPKHSASSSSPSSWIIRSHRCHGRCCRRRSATTAAPFGTSINQLVLLTIDDSPPLDFFASTRFRIEAAAAAGPTRPCQKACDPARARSTFVQCRTHIKENDYTWSVFTTTSTTTYPRTTVPSSLCFVAELSATSTTPVAAFQNGGRELDIVGKLDFRNQTSETTI
jgi:hypothetical protein